MSTLAEEVLAAVNRDLKNLGDSAPTEVVEDIVVQHAMSGAGDDPVLQQEAAELARERLRSGLDPDDAAVSAATQTYQKSVSQRPSAEAHGAALQGGKQDEIPGQDEIDEYLATHDDANMTSEQRQLLDNATQAFGDVGMDADLAAQAQAAIVNAASDGALMPAGIDISGNLTAVVHNDVTLDLQSDHIKTTKGEVVYNHTAGNFQLNAEDVKLTANSVYINASKTETNIVSQRKKSVRYLYSRTSGTTTSTTNPFWDVTLTGAGLDANAVNASFGSVRVGAAVRMDTWGAGRTGFKGLNYKDVPAKWMHKGNRFLIKLAAALIIL